MISASKSTKHIIEVRQWTQKNVQDLKDFNHSPPRDFYQGLSNSHKTFCQSVHLPVIKPFLYIQYYSTTGETFCNNVDVTWPFFIYQTDHFLFILKYFSVCNWHHGSFNYHIALHIDSVQCITISINQINRTRRNKLLCNLLLFVRGPCQHFAVGFMGCGRYQLLNLWN